MTISEIRKIFTTKTIPERLIGILDEITLVYETYGELNNERDNAILVIHGFSASSHVASHHCGDAPGWWEWAVGPGRPLDTDRFFVVCANNLGSCFGSTGPMTVSKQAGKPLAMDFPFPSITDIVFCQRKLQEKLAIPQWHAVIGGSLGGMAALEWAGRYPDKVGHVVCLNAGAKLSHIGHGLMDAQADIIKMGGTVGLQIARRLATLSYVGEGYFRRLEEAGHAWRMADWLSSEAEEFATRFDQFSYLGFLSAMQTFNCSPLYLSERLRVIIVGCVEDILFPPEIVRETTQRFAPFKDTSTRIVSSICGHDAFLLDDVCYSTILREIFN